MSVSCPKCGSKQIGTHQKGFSVGQAAVGGAIWGPTGLLGGLVGSGKLKITCLSCGHSWYPGQVVDKYQRSDDIFDDLLLYIFEYFGNNELIFIKWMMIAIFLGVPISLFINHTFTQVLILSIFCFANIFGLCWLFMFITDLIWPTNKGKIIVLICISAEVMLFSILYCYSLYNKTFSSIIEAIVFGFLGGGVIAAIFMMTFSVLQIIVLIVFSIIRRIFSKEGSHDKA